MRSWVHRSLHVGGTFTAAWLFSHVAVSSGGVAPEMTLVEAQRRTAEYPVMRALTDVLLELQLMELAVKNRRDAQLEARLARTMEQVQENGRSLTRRLRGFRSEQNALLENFASADALSRDAELRLGGETLARFRAPKGAAASVSRRIDEVNGIFASAKAEHDAFILGSYRSLHEAFQEHRYGLFQRIEAARRGLLQLARMNTTMGVPEESGALYNTILDHLYSFGVDIALGESRDITLQGFLLAPEPGEARRRLERLRLAPLSAQTYNSPSG